MLLLCLQSEDGIDRAIPPAEEIARGCSHWLGCVCLIRPETPTPKLTSDHLPIRIVPLRMDALDWIDRLSLAWYWVLRTEADLRSIGDAHCSQSESKTC